jgi:RimJ/RimL family protein N-acetyltransferase
MGKMQFKQATIKDWKLVEKLEKGSESPFFEPCTGEEGYKRYIEESKVFFIINNKNPIGTISYKIDKKAILVNGLTILPKYRGEGIATKAMKKLLSKLGNKNITLVVHPKNIPALLIYLRFGFAIIGWKDNYFGNGQPRLFLRKNKNQ